MVRRRRTGRRTHERRQTISGGCHEWGEVSIVVSRASSAVGDRRRRLWTVPELWKTHSAELSALLCSADAPLTLVTVRDQQWFSKARAQNIGAAHSPHDLLFFCDCDILLGDDALDELIDRVTTDKGAFGTVAGVTETERNARGAGNVVRFGYQLNLRLANGRTLQIIDNEEDASTAHVRRLDFS
jgi:hypothetical protein